MANSLRRRPWHEPFFDALTHGLSPQQAAALVGISYSRVRKLRSSSPEFKRLSDDAQIQYHEGGVADSNALVGVVFGDLIQTRQDVLELPPHKRALAQQRLMRAIVDIHGAWHERRLKALRADETPPDDIGSRRFTIWEALREGRGLPDGPVDDTDPNAHTDSDEDEDVGMDASGAEQPDRAAGTPSRPAAGRHSA